MTDLPTKPSTDVLDPRTQVIAMLVAGRYEVPEIARAVGVPLSDIYALKEREDFTEVVARFAQRYSKREINEMRSMLDNDAPHNFEFIRAVRNGEISEDTKMLALRMDAAKALLDRQVRKESSEVAAPTVVIQIDARRRDVIAAALVEDSGDVIDLEDDIA
jgi:hypothetical protein